MNFIETAEEECLTVRAGHVLRRQHFEGAVPVAPRYFFLFHLDFAGEADIVEKFTKLATHVVPRSQAEAIAEWILGLEERPDARALSSLLVRNG